jgi:hypothetical protein
MRIPVIEAVVLIIPDLDHPTLHPECITIVFSHFMMMDFYDPVVKILTIEEPLPTSRYSGGASKKGSNSNGCEKASMMFHSPKKQKIRLQQGPYVKDLANMLLSVKQSCCLTVLGYCSALRNNMLLMRFTVMDLPLFSNIAWLFTRLNSQSFLTYINRRKWGIIPLPEQLTT